MALCTPGMGRRSWQDTMHRAWKRVKEHTGAPGVDTMPIDEMPDSLREHWKEMRDSVMEERSQPWPV